MRDITYKTETLRTARGIGVVFCQSKTQQLIMENRLPKGNLFDVARAAAYLGAKQTQSLIPHCHPVSIDGMEVRFEYLEPTHLNTDLNHYQEHYGVVIYAVGKSVGRTGIEMEVLTAISVAALTIYDLLKNIDKEVEIGGIRLLEKRGGKSDREQLAAAAASSAILVCSDTASIGERDDESGMVIRELLSKHGAPVADYAIVPDEREAIAAQLQTWIDQDVPYIFCTGGTGTGPRDITPEVVYELCDRELPGVAEAMRGYGQQRTQLAMLSRSVAGMARNTTIISLPGSPKGVRESLQAVMPGIFHTRSISKGGGHD